MPADGYLRSLLTAGARPVRHRGGVRELLGLPEPGARISFTTGPRAAGFVYRRTGAAAPPATQATSWQVQVVEDPADVDSWPVAPGNSAPAPQPPESTPPGYARSTPNPPSPEWRPAVTTGSPAGRFHSGSTRPDGTVPVPVPPAGPQQSEQARPHSGDPVVVRVPGVTPPPLPAAPAPPLTAADPPPHSFSSRSCEAVPHRDHAVPQDRKGVDAQHSDPDSERRPAAPTPVPPPHRAASGDSPQDPGRLDRARLTDQDNYSPSTEPTPSDQHAPVGDVTPGPEHHGWPAHTALDQPQATRPGRMPSPPGPRPARRAAETTIDIPQPDPRPARRTAETTTGIPEPGPLRQPAPRSTTGDGAPPEDAGIAPAGLRARSPVPRKAAGHRSEPQPALEPEPISPPPAPAAPPAVPVVVVAPRPGPAAFWERRNVGRLRGRIPR
ncbi:hypothetical protein GA0070624_5121 [Micromonospora rhizosphaerae]|uniref:Uncharacterized protein n=1 Tax=Micromonospora rhizosphaerae TaxID=568872 RepID=A0A1C6SZU4_9ACTN|nr:hypothetical protein GA0070624_5121 [Micromonospora rhizosphaerae]